MKFLVVSIYALIGYLLGSLNAAILVSKSIYKDDIRNHGSGNAGTTNMLRTFGKKAALFTLLIDLFKGIVACLVPCIITYVIVGNHELGLLSMLGAALGSVLGHNFPVYFGFKGGKGVLISFSVMLFLAPIPALIALAAFIVVVAIWRYVSLGSMTAAVVFPVACFFIGGWAENTKGLTTFFFVGLIICVLLIVRHYQNIGRLIKHTESKISFKK